MFSGAVASAFKFQEKTMSVHINALEKKKAESSALDKCHLTGVTW